MDTAEPKDPIQTHAPPPQARSADSSRSSHTNANECIKIDGNELPADNADSDDCDQFQPEARLLSTHLDRAWELVERLFMLWEVNNGGRWGNRYIRLASRDDMVFMAENLVRLQEEWRNDPHSYRHKVEIGYHWTRAENMRRISTDGLLTKRERDFQGIVSKYNGSKYGDGVYTAVDPFTFCNDGKYGDICVMLACLKGNMGRYAEYSYSNQRVDTVVDRSEKMAVLQESSQCFPIFSFQRLFLENATVGRSVVALCHQDTQKLLDEFFNNGRETPIDPKPRQSCHLLPRRRSAADSSWSSPISSEREKERSMIRPTPSKRFHKYTAPGNIEDSVVFGKSPSAIMVYLKHDALRCQGFFDCGTIVIKYIVEKGVQQDYHPNPREYHDSFQRVAFLPDNQEGNQLLSRLEDAFLSGCMFFVRLKDYENRPNAIDWLVPHKTLLATGFDEFRYTAQEARAECGYPDPKFFDAANSVLDSYLLVRE